MSAVLQSPAGGVCPPACPPGLRLLLTACTQPQLPTRASREHVPHTSTPPNWGRVFRVRGLIAAVTWDVSRTRLLMCRPELGHGSESLEAMLELLAQLPCLHLAM